MAEWSGDAARWRVKVYSLSSDGSWSDKGTGMVLPPKGAQLVVAAEDVPDALLVTLPLDRTRADAIISWEAADSSDDVALSFQDSRGADSIWRTIQTKLAAADHPAEAPTEVPADTHPTPTTQAMSSSNNFWAPTSMSSYSHVDEEEAANRFMQPRPLTPPDSEIWGAYSGPPSPVLSYPASVKADELQPAAGSSVTVQNIPPITWLHTLENTPAARNDAANRLLADECALLRGYLSGFTQAEKSAAWDATSATMYGNFARDLLMLNEAALFGALVEPEHFLAFVGCCEYLPGTTGRHNWREQLRSRVKFRGAAFVTDDEIMAVIEQTFRLQFIRDCVLSRHFDENVMNTLGAMVISNYSDLVSCLVAAPAVLTNAMSAIRSSGAMGTAAASERSSSKCSVCGTRSAVSQDLTLGTERDAVTAASTSTPSSGPSAAAVTARVGDLHAFGGAFPEEDYVPESPRECAVDFLMEMLHIAKAVGPISRTNLLQALLEPGTGSTTILPALEPVLGDRQARRGEVRQALELLQTVAQHDIACVRMHCGRQRKHPLAPPTGPEPPTDVRPYAQRGFLDDGRSIRLCEKLSELGLVTEFPHRVSEDLCGWNMQRVRYGEHGALVEPADRFSSMLHMLVWRIVDDPDSTVQAMAGDVVRAMLDADMMPATERDAFLTMFYDNYLPWLLRPFLHVSLPEVVHMPAANVKDVLAGAPGSGASRYQTATWLRATVAPQLGPRHDKSIGEESAGSKSSKCTILELVSLCIQRHSFRIKFVLLRTQLIHKITRLLRYRERPIILSAVKMLKVCLLAENDFYNRSFIKNDVLSGVVAVMAASATREDLVTSACEDLLQFIDHEAKGTALRVHVKTHYLAVLSTIRQLWVVRAPVPGADATSHEAWRLPPITAAASSTSGSEDEEAEDRYFSDVGSLEEPDYGPVPPAHAAAASVPPVFPASARLPPFPATASSAPSQGDDAIFDFVDELDTYHAPAPAFPLPPLPDRPKPASVDEDSKGFAHHSIPPRRTPTQAKGKITFSLRTSSLPTAHPAASPTGSTAESSGHDVAMSAASEADTDSQFERGVSFMPVFR